MPVGRRPVLRFVKQSAFLAGLSLMTRFMLPASTGIPRPDWLEAPFGGPFPLKPPRTESKSPLPSGGDDTAIIQQWLNECAGKRAVFTSVGGVKYRIEGTLEPPAESWIEAQNPASCEIEKIGNGDLFRLSAATVCQNMFVRAETKQANGAAFDVSHHPANECKFYNIQLGDNFFNGFNLVPEKELATGGGYYLDTIVFQDIAHRAKTYGNAAFVIGNSNKKTEEHRAISVYMREIDVRANARADMPFAFKIQNTDSIHLNQVLCVNCKVGFRIGENDESPLRTTNSFFYDVQMDGCETGYFIENLQERATFSGCTAEACLNGCLYLAGNGGVKFVGCDFSANEQHGFHVFGSASFESSLVLNGCTFHCNGKKGEAEMCGILVDEGAGGLVISGCSFGNPINCGSQTQKIGLKLTKANKSVMVKANRFVSGGVGVNASITEPGAGCPTLAELEAANLMV